MNDIVIVQSDLALKMAGMTRNQYNKQNPAAEKMWHKAWAAEGQKWDNRELAGIRKETTRPASDHGAANAPATTASTAKGS
ncbi:hypothetical protein LBW60_23455 [Ralstonia solanacearum]|uniref:hypothetical protein n=1 Tax=Ralstonia solanacearum TaxID=305 RepID=UPI002306D09B|nr:hypothetical protein [Ralstonia solanacearum]MDB0516278.1 hypothetical protein [Ralstonia solanacearum]